MTYDLSMAHPDELALAAVVARKHYVGAMSKTEIGEQLFLSRFKVARLLELAVEQQIVKFTIDLGGDANQDLTAELRSSLRLQHVVVVDDDGIANADLFRRVGDAVVRLLSETVQTGDAVGISSTRALMALQRVDVPLGRSTFVQLNGSLSRPDAADIIDGIRKLTAASPGGRAHVFYAPLVAPDEQMWRRYQEQPDARVAFAKFADLAVAVTGIGAWRPGLSVTYDNLPEATAEDAAEHGASYEILGVPINADGRTIDGAARRRIVAPDAEILQRVPLRIGVGVGEEKADAVTAVIRAGLVNCLVSHRRLAERLVA
jgi:DNA-binding transcriptional regulator LsrR (DeoR family)